MRQRWAQRVRSHVSKRGDGHPVQRGNAPVPSPVSTDALVVAASPVTMASAVVVAVSVATPTLTCVAAPSTTRT